MSSNNSLEAAFTLPFIASNMNPSTTLSILMAFSLLVIVDNKIYLSHTENGPAIEYYDCILVGSILYCRRPDDAMDLNRALLHHSCEGNGGKIHRFRDLRSKHVNISLILHRWRSSLEQAEAYNRYLSHPTDDFDGFLCECQRNGSFGKYCEYQLPAGSSFKETLDWQVLMRKNNSADVQRFGNITGYEGIGCDSGLLPLDWREICDGVQQCMFGLDEEQCDLLELNRCDDHEYRCLNGMCIPKEYFLDGEMDCLDWSDEMRAIKESEGCGYERVSTECDDHMCLSKEWPCGDGQCITDRFAFQTMSHTSCVNRRDQYYMCETHDNDTLWTMPNGRCIREGEYVVEVKNKISNEEHCEYLLKCALSLGAAIGCPCDRMPSDCADRLEEDCPLDIIRYPLSGFPTPYIQFYFNRVRSDFEFKPDWLVINGTLKCQGTLVNVTENALRFSEYTGLVGRVQEFVCEQSRNVTQTKGGNLSDFCIHPHQSTDICDDWNPCMSITRIKDGRIDCLNGRDESNRTMAEIETTCLHRPHHRFRCSSEQPTCLSIVSFGDDQEHCSNRNDELWHGTNRKISYMNCNNRWKDECSLLRRYFEQSWSSTSHQDLSLTLRIPFRSYCDSFRDLVSGEDDDRFACQQWWICAPNQWQCHSGECVNKDWLSDRQWDCRDGSDEHERFGEIGRKIEHNLLQQKDIIKLTAVFNGCLRNESFFCLSPSTPDTSYTCLNFSQLGDQRIDCLGGIDERNTLAGCSTLSSVLGDNFLCPSTNTCIPYFHHCQSDKRCPNRSDDDHWCQSMKISSSFTHSNDIRCFDQKHLKGGRCDRTLDCSFGEDEYMCDYPSENEKAFISYRAKKELETLNTHRRVQLLVYPNNSNVTMYLEDPTGLVGSSNTPTFVHQSSLTSQTPFVCNRGVGILHQKDSIVCFCPPQYYGRYCEHHADRLIVLLHLNLSQSIYTLQSDVRIVIKLLVLFLYQEQVLTTHEFHVRVSTEIHSFTKKRVHLPYSRSFFFRQHRKNRYFNRSDIIDFQPYSVRIEAYERHDAEVPVLIAVWQYPIEFDYLPVYQFSKVLHLIKSDEDENNPCQSDPCPANAQCHSLVNDRSRYLCLCKTNYRGKNCSIEDEQCLQGYCTSSQSLCKPEYRRLLRGNITPYCICSFNRFGDQCDLVHDYCQIKPCQNNGSCFPTSQPDKVACICDKYHYGSLCEFKRSRIRLAVLDRIQHYAGVVLQYFNLHPISLDPILMHQEVYNQLPSSIDYLQQGATVPVILLAKIYYSHEMEADLHLLSVHANVASIEGTTQLSEENRCPDVQSIANVSSPIEYHQICRRDSQLLCFRTDVYLCVCGVNHSHVECFRYDPQLDRCSFCYAGGRCLLGDAREKNDFKCLCPACYSGPRCQFTSKSFAFSLDQLLLGDLMSNTRQTRALLLIFSGLFALLAIPNNLFSFVTFRRDACFRKGIGIYLFCLSVINQLNLSFFFIRLIHLVIGMADVRVSRFVDETLCRFVSYAWTCSFRLVYWISSLIALERLNMTVAINGQWMQNPSVARRLLVFTIILVFGSSFYELIFYKSYYDWEKSQRIICVFQYPPQSSSLWAVIHPALNVFHSFLPFLINLCSMIIISKIVIQKKMNTLRTSRSDPVKKMTFQTLCRLAMNVLIEKKELVLGPAITLVPQLFAVPRLIIASALHCENLDKTWSRYILIASIWISLTPSFTSFFLYITPSTLYSSEWRKTNIAQWIYRTCGWTVLPATLATMTIFSKTREQNREKF